MDVNVSIQGEAKFQAFIEEFASIDLETAKKELETQFLADEKANRFVLHAKNSKDGQEHSKSYMGIAMSYDAQGTQLGGGKAYLDKGQEVARKDITIVFM